MDVEITNEQEYFENIICELFLGSPEYWGPPAYSRSILNLFWKKHIKYKDRFKLSVFVANNCLPTHIFFKWIDHIGQCRDQSARKHIESLFTNWERGVHLQYYAYNIINKRFETLQGIEVDLSTASKNETLKCDNQQQLQTDGFTSDSDLDNPNSNFYLNFDSDSDDSIPCGQTKFQNTTDCFSSDSDLDDPKSNFYI